MLMVFVGAVVLDHHHGLAVEPCLQDHWVQGRLHTSSVVVLVADVKFEFAWRLGVCFVALLVLLLVPSVLRPFWGST